MAPAVLSYGESLWRTVGPAHHAVPLSKPNCPSTDQVVPPIRPWEIDWGDSCRIWYQHLIHDIKHESFQPSLRSTWLNNRDQSNGYVCLVVLLHMTVS